MSLQPDFVYLSPFTTYKHKKQGSCRHGTLPQHSLNLDSSDIPSRHHPGDKVINYQAAGASYAFVIAVSYCLEPQCAARPNWLTTYDGLGSRPGRGMGFSVGWTNSGHAVRLISLTGTEGLPVPCINCDRPLHSGIRAPEL